MNLGNKKVFANNLKQYLNDKEVTQKAVAQYVGVSRGTFCDWIKERAYPRMDKIEKLADYFGIQKSDLIEEHSINSEYYMAKELQALSDELLREPQTIELIREIQHLSKRDRNIVQELVRRLNYGD